MYNQRKLLFGMKKILPFLFLALMACDDDDPSNPDAKLLMTFDPRFGGTEMQMGEVNENIHGYPFHVSGMKFYLSEITLLDEDSRETRLSEIELIDIAENRRTLEYVVPPGNYSGVKFGLGVPVELNGTNNPDFSTALYDANHPLSVSNGMYWVWQTGYRFFIFEGRYDTVANNSGILPMSYAFHTGTDTLYRHLGPFSKNINIQAGSSKVLSFNLEVDSMFVSGSDTVDLAVESAFHGSAEEIDLGIKVANNLARSFVLK